LLEILREYCRWKKPATWLFPRGIGPQRRNRAHHRKDLWYACSEADRHADLHKRVTPHMLRRCSTNLKRKGYLHSSEQRNAKSRRRVFRATPLGRKALASAKQRVRELFNELLEDE
jgi:DNA-binding PadR family transcriptional regulator